MTKRELLSTEISSVRDHEWKLLIGGELRTAQGGATFTDFDSVTTDALAEIPDASTGDVDAAVAAADEALAAWRRIPALERAELVYGFADIVERNGDELAFLDALDTGSPISNAEFDVRLAVSQIRMFANAAIEMKGQTIPASANLHYTIRQPVGIVAKIFPYNHPLMFACRVAAPLVAGNATVVKPPEAAPLSVLRLGELLQGHFPAGVLNIVVGNGPRVPDHLVRHPKVRRIGFIGSEPTGRAIQRAAAESGVKHVTLELGGKNAMIVFDDADLEKAAHGAVNGMNFTWSGQSCGSNSRVLVHRSVYDAFATRVAEIVRQRRIGDSLDPASEQGAMINETQFQKSMRYLDIARAEGARVLVGGGRPEGEQFEKGHFVAATVLADVDPKSTVGQEEIFGPVMSLIPFDEEDEAIRIANDVDYGLTGSVWTNDLNRAHRVAHEMETGYIWINGSSVHYHGVPYGGVKRSGVGGKEESLEELLSYTEEKVVNLVL